MHSLSPSSSPFYIELTIETLIIILDNRVIIKVKKEDSMLTQERLKQVLLYNWKTGVFIRRTSPNNRCKIGDVVGTEHKNQCGKIYLRVSIDSKPYLLHRLAFLYMTGKFPPNQVDHQNGAGTCNAFLNLRYATNRQNGVNQKLHNSNTSGVAGVYGFAYNWRAQIYTNGSKIDLGCHEDFFEAVCERKSAELKYKYHNNHGQIRPL